MIDKSTVLIGLGFAPEAMPQRHQQISLRLEPDARQLHHQSINPSTLDHDTCFHRFNRQNLFYSSREVILSHSLSR
ncbi:hypothetical protein BJX70DRAFT_251328 [Aspergillus crustosus]